MTSIQKESEWEKKWNDGVRPCVWDEVADFITAIVSTREKEIAEEVERLPEMKGNHSEHEAYLIDRADVLQILKH